LPSDVTGTHILDRRTGEFVLRPGPIFCQVLLADEVNRAPAKTQSALLEAMQEGQVTIEGTTLRVKVSDATWRKVGVTAQLLAPDGGREFEPRRDDLVREATELMKILGAIVRKSEE
jgi:hypothetical protein